MKRKIYRVKFVFSSAGTQIITQARSRRGTPFIAGGSMVPRDGKSRSDHRLDRAAALNLILGDKEPF